MKDALLKQIEEILRETFEGALPGQGTQYLDKSGGIRATLDSISAEKASRSLRGHPTIAAHARHMGFHLRTVGEWIEGERHRRDWKGSFEPQTVSEEEWSRVKQDLESSRQQFLRVMRSLDPEKLVEEGAGYGAIAHLAYHLGAIRQLLHQD